MYPELGSWDMEGNSEYGRPVLISIIALLNILLGVIVLVLGVLGVLRVLNILGVLRVLGVLDILGVLGVPVGRLALPVCGRKKASAGCGCLFFRLDADC